MRGTRERAVSIGIAGRLNKHFSFSFPSPKVKTTPSKHTEVSLYFTLPSNPTMITRRACSQAAACIQRSSLRHQAITNPKTCSYPGHRLHHQSSPRENQAQVTRRIFLATAQAGSQEARSTFLLLPPSQTSIHWLNLPRRRTLLSPRACHQQH